MIRHSKSPIKATPRTSIAIKQPLITPQQPTKKPMHRHTSSTPVPFRSPSTSRTNKANKKMIPKPSIAKVLINKVDLRKGIFSKKQSLGECTEKSGKSTNRTSDTPVPSNRISKYHSLSKEFIIDKRGLRQKELRDNQGFYIPDKPPMMYEDLNNINAN